MPGIGAHLDGQVATRGVFAADNLQDAAVANGGVSLLREHGIQEIDGVLGADGLTGDDIHGAGHRHFLDDHEPGGIA